MDELGNIAETTSFAYVTASGEARVRIVIPARQCFSGCDSSPVTPDNPWFVLGHQGCGPPGSSCGGLLPPAGVGYTLSTAPYTTPNPALLPANPNNPSPVPNHSNVMRHWSGMSEDIPVQVIISCPFNSPGSPVPTSATTDIFAGTALATVPPAPPFYSWETWKDDIQTTFAKFTSVSSAEVWVTTSVVYANTPILATPTSPGYSSLTAYGVYDNPTLPLPLPLPAPLAATGQLIWDYSVPPVAEPNGTGPTGNGFNEVIFLQRRVVNNGGFCSMDLNAQTGAIIECDVVFDVNSFIGGMGSTGLPNQTTAFVHEIGHFFGLDHTNLHPGLVLGAPPISTSYPGFPSWMSYTGAPAEYPGMTSGVTRFVGTNMVTGIPELHIDDAMGLSRIYPVQSPASGKDPLINTTATIRGRLNNPLPNGKGRFGDNVFPITRAPGTTAPTVRPDLAFNLSRVGTISGTARLASTDVVGALDTATGSTSSGAFEIIGLKAPFFNGVSPHGRQFDIVAEYLGYCGLSTGAYGEWYYESFLNPGWNLVPTIAPSVGNQTRFLSNDGTSVPLGTTAWVPGGIAVVGSFSVFPGTIIDVGTVTHLGGGNAVSSDATSRPLTYIVERTRPAPGAPLTLVSISNYPVNIAGMSLTVNGTNFSLTQPLISPVMGTGPVLTLTIPATLVNALLPSGGPPARLVFTATETGPPPPGISFVAGVNHVQY